MMSKMNVGMLCLRNYKKMQNPCSIDKYINYTSH